VNKHQWEPVTVIPSKTHGKPEACVDVACGSNHVLVLTAGGEVYAWGDGEQGQLGRKILERTKIHGVTPAKVVIGGRNKRFKVIGAGFFTSYAVDTDGNVYSWGLNNAGQTGTNDNYDDEELVVTAPKLVPELSPSELSGETVVQIVGGEKHVLFRTSGGRVFSCGLAVGGQLGLADSHRSIVERKKLLKGADIDYIIKPSEIAFPVDVKTDPIVHVEVGIRNNLAISKDGALYSWGEGNQGELGLGEDETNATTPQVVVRRSGGSWKAVGAACGGQHTIGLFRKRE
jgi:regulator of chromosome condensation